MTAYVIADIDVHDWAVYRDYASRVPETVQRYGGRFLVRGGDHETWEGAWRPGRVVVLEFPNAEQARRWYESAEYTAARAIRHRASTGSLVLVDGATPGNATNPEAT